MKLLASAGSFAVSAMIPHVQRIPVIVDSKLRVQVDDIGQDVGLEILRELTLANEERAKALDSGRGYQAADMPEFFEMAEVTEDGETLVLPRGYAVQLKLLLRDHDMAVWWRDRRKWAKGKPLGKDEFSYRPHQPAAVKAIRRHQQLIYKAPTGSGKTVTVCGAIWELSPQRSLILVDRINLVDQWCKRIAQHMGIPIEDVGVIGSGKWTEGRVTVATVQTLYARRHELQEAGWFDLWHFVCMDECHHVTAETYMNLVSRFSARYLMGTSATPDKTGIFEMALNTLGEVAYETTQEELRELGILVEPTINVVPTDFTFAYWRDHKASKSGHCEMVGCKSRKPFHAHRNNYHKLKQAVVEDRERNALIVSTIATHLDAVQLVITDQVKQIDALHGELEEAAAHGLDLPPVYILTGKQSRKQREAIISRIEDEEEPCIILSTIAGEALDIAIISVVHLVFPTRNPRKTEQNVGRGTRSHDNKGDTLIYDYADFNVGVLGKQFGTRMKKCYIPMGFKVNIPEDAGAKKRKGGLGTLGILG